MEQGRSAEQNQFKTLCTQCRDTLPIEHVVCAGKGCLLHFQCAGIKEVTWRKADKSNWKCPECRKVPKTNTHNTTSDAVTPQEMREFMAIVKNKLSTIDELLELKPLVQNLEEAVQFMSSQFDELKSKQEKHDKEIISITEKLAMVETQSAAKDKKICELKKQMMDQEQHSRVRNIEVSGVEFKKGENLKNVMRKIANDIGVDFEDNDIDITHRVPTKSTRDPPKIIAQFTSRTIRNEWLLKKKELTLLSRDVVAGSCSTEKVYIGEHLSPAWKELLWKARLSGKPKGYNLIWYKYGKILAKKNIEDRNIIYIQCEEDIAKLI